MRECLCSLVPGEVVVAPAMTLPLLFPDVAHRTTGRIVARRSADGVWSMDGTNMILPLQSRRYRYYCSQASKAPRCTLPLSRVELSANGRGVLLLRSLLRLYSQHGWAVSGRAPSATHPQPHRGIHRWHGRETMLPLTAV